MGAVMNGCFQVNQHPVSSPIKHIFFNPFNRLTRYVLKATTPCAIAYG